MPKSDTEYDRRMHAVLDHIDRHLDQDLRLDDLAEVAHFSPFHFHRLFSAWSGESVGEYLRRRRVEMAAIRLSAQPGVSVLQVALSVGFSSAEAFARAFRARFACSPSQWRKSKQRRLDSKPDQAAQAATAHPVSQAKHDWEKIMKVKLVDRAAVDVAYLRKVGPYGPEISRFWQESVYPWMVSNGLLGLPRYGVSLDDPTVTAPDKCRYDACVAVDKEKVLAGKPMRKSIPGGRYAALEFEGTSQEVKVAWDSLLRDWLPTSGLQLDARPFFEYYPPQATYDPKTGKFQCELCVPVAPL